jgi:steroid 5-alpha reductase family enzyme
MSSSLLALLPILFALTLLITAIGFRRMVYFLNIGYAFAIVAVVIVSAASFWNRAPILPLLQSAALTVWGLRLGIFVTRRELSPNFKKERERIDQIYGGIKLPAKFAIWMTVSVLYLMMVSPNLISLGSAAQPSVWRSAVQGLGWLVMVSGLALEGLADQQKTAFKAQHPHTFCRVGWYRWVRCPNYLGEITVWVGNWIMGIAFYQTPPEWILSLLGLACIIFIMVGSTRRLEGTQLKRYGNLPEYQQYIQTVPVLFPYLPLYTLQNTRILFG